MKPKFNIGDKVRCTDDGWLGRQELEIVSIAIHRDDPLSYGCSDTLGNYHFVYEEELMSAVSPKELPPAIKTKFNIGDKVFSQQYRHTVLTDPLTIVSVSTHEGAPTEYGCRTKDGEWFLFEEDDLVFATDQPTDNVNHPSHYGQGKIEAIEYISDVLTPEEYQGYLRGNIAKYLHRWPWKGKPVEDLKKAAWYLDRLLKEVDSGK